MTNIYPQALAKRTIETKLDKLFRMINVVRNITEQVGITPQERRQYKETMYNIRALYLSLLKKINESRDILTSTELNKYIRRLNKAEQYISSIRKI